MRENEDTAARAAVTAFWTLCAIHLLVWTAVPSLMYSTVPKDTLEVIAWGNMWLPGYDKHPPLAAWLGAFATDLFGTVGWPVFLMSQLAIVLCFWAVWSLAREMMHPWRAFVAVGLLEGVYYYNVGSFTFNPNIVMLPTWAMLTLTTYRALRQPNVWRWAHAGLWAGLACLAKYESGLLAVALLFTLVITREGRRSLTTPGPYIGIAVALLIAIPNLVWLAEHDFISLRYAVDDAQVGQTAPRYLPLLFLAEQVGAVLPAVLLYLVLRRGGWRFDRRNFNHVFVLLTVLGPLTLAVLIGFATRAIMIPRWGFPFFSFFGVALMLFLGAKVRAKPMLGFGAALVTLNLLLVAGVYWTIFVQPYRDGRPPYSITFPARPLAEQVTEHWRQQFGVPMPYVGGDRYIISGVAAYSADRPVPFFDWDDRSNPWLDERRLHESGAVFVHWLNGNGDSDLIAGLRRRFPELSGEEVITLPHQSRAPLQPESFWVAYLPPAKCAGRIDCLQTAALTY